MREITEVIKDLCDHELYEEALSVCRKSFNEDGILESIKYLANTLQSKCIDLASQKMDAGCTYSELEKMHSDVKSLVDQVG